MASTTPVRSLTVSPQSRISPSSPRRRFASITSRGGHWQRIFDFGNGTAQDNIYLSQVGNSNTISFTVFRDDVAYSFDVSDAIVKGEVATWKATISDSGVMMLYKNDVLIGQRQGVVPADVERTSNLVGSSNWSWDSPLKGEVLSINVDQNYSGSRANEVPPAPVEVKVADSAGDYTLAVWDLAHVSFQGTRYDPFPDSTGGRSTGDIAGGTFTFGTGAAPVAVGVWDNDGNFNDGDGSQDLVQSLTMKGVTEIAGGALVPEYAYKVREVGSAEVFTIFLAEVRGNNIVGLVSGKPMQAGVAYEFVERVSTAPSVAYADLADSYLVDPPKPVLETFDGGAAGWSHNDTTVNAGNAYLGQFGTQFVQKTFDLGAGATSAMVSFDVLEIDSWDGERFLITVNGQQINLGSFNGAVDEGAASFTLGNVTVVKQAAVDIAGYGNNVDWWALNDKLHRFTLTVANPCDKLTLGFTSTLDQAVGDESWGVDNLKITVEGGPASPSYTIVDGKIVASDMLHGSDGRVAMAGETFFFHGQNKDGDFVYGKERLQNDEKASYDLTDNDVAFLMKQAKLGVVAAGDLADVSDARGVRELDGFGNNVKNPLWGNADQTFKRLSFADYANGVDAPREGPNARDISNTVLNQNRDGLTNLFGANAGDSDRDLVNGFRGNELVAAFGQYFDHGLDFVPKGGVNGDGVAAGSLSIGNGGFPLSMTRGSVAEGTGVTTAREHFNQTSPFIDQNKAYGSNEAVLEFLLERSDNGRVTGRLLSGPDGGLPTLGEAKANWKKGVDAGLAEVIDWSDPSTLSNFRGSGDALLLDINRGVPLDLHLVAGDGRVNEKVGLSTVHTIWKNNHNFWVEKLLEHFNSKGGIPADLSAQHIFNMAKIINEAEYQRASFDEFVELLVGSDVHRFRDYNPNINADITHEFAAAAYRLGHSMLNNTITVATGDGANRDVPLFDLFLNPVKFRELGATNIMDGMIDVLHQEIDAKIVTTLRNNLVGRPLDLGSLNIARGRELGLPTLNDMRESVGLPRYTDWESFRSNLRDPADLDRFKAAYASVDMVDLWVGGLAEKPSPTNAFGTRLALNSVMGETFAQVFSVQMICAAGRRPLLLQASPVRDRTAAQPAEPGLRRHHRAYARP